MSNEIAEPIYDRKGGSSRPNSGNANWKIDSEGSHIYRILPPFGGLSSKGEFSKYEALHWGFALSTGKKRAFKCIRRKNSKTKMIEVECPMCSEYDKRQAAFDSKKKDLENNKVSPTEAKQVLSKDQEWLQRYNCQRGHFLNVMRPDGQIGRLFIKIKAKQALDITIKELRGEGYSPAGIANGVWLDFIRIGMGRNDTTYQVRAAEETMEVNGRKMKSIKTSALSAEVLERMKTEAWDLSNYYKDLSFNEIQMLVQSDGDPKIVDSVFGAPTVQDSAPSDEGEQDFEEPPMNAKHYEEAKSAPVMNEEDAVLAQLAAIRAKKQGAVAKSADVSTEDFVAAFKSGKL